MPLQHQYTHFSQSQEDVTVDEGLLDAAGVASPGKETQQRLEKGKMDSPLTLAGHSSHIVAQEWAPDGQSIATCSTDGTARIWDVLTSRCVHRITGHRGAVLDVTWAPNSHRFATASKDTTIGIWNVEDGAQLWVLKGHSKPVVSVDFSPDGTRLASASEDGAVKIWDVSAARCTFSFPVMADDGTEVSLRAVKWSGDGTRVLVTGSDRTGRIFTVPASDTEDRIREATLRMQEAQSHAAEISAKFLEFQEALVAEKAKVSELEADLAKERTENAEKAQQIQTLQQSEAEALALRDASVQAAEEYEARIKSLEQELANAEEERHHFETHSEHTVKELETHRDSATSMQKKLTATQRRLDDLKTEMAAERAALESLRSQNALLSKKSQKLEKRLKTNQVALDEAREQVKMLTEGLEADMTFEAEEED